MARELGLDYNDLPPDDDDQGQENLAQPLANVPREDAAKIKGTTRVALNK